VRAPLSVAVVAPLVAPLSDAHPYGNQHLLCDLARGLDERGHDVVIYAAAGSRVPGVAVETVDVDPRVQRRFVLLRENACDETDAMQRVFDALFARLQRGRHDVVSQHAFDREAIAGCAGLPVLHTLHLPPMRADIVATVGDCSEPLATVSHHCAAAWSKALGRDVLALPNGVPDFAPPCEAPVEDVALSAGRISREKGTATAVRAARVAGLRPLVVGEVYDRDYFDGEVAASLGESRVVAPMPRSSLARLMARAAVVLMPVEWDEPFGLVAAEAQLAGCPVVGYRCGALPEVVEDGVGGFLVEPGDEAALVAAIGRARTLDRRAIRRRALHAFSMSACVERHEAALLGLLQ
jgi:glycosyltransferase involved in cell wall biosynthesis